jgi:hypothetical protein
VSSATPLHPASRSASTPKPWRGRERRAHGGNLSPVAERKK